jgi:tetratricopeptide (TPR) repeat protein
MRPGNDKEANTMMTSIRNTTVRKAMLLALVLLITPLLVSCEDTDAEALAQLAVDWAVGKGVMTLRCEGEGQTNCEYDLNEVALGVYITGVKLATSWDRSPEMQAALDAGDVVLNQEEADELAERGAREGDLDLIDQAIEARPEDWSYHDQQAAVLLADGKIEDAEDSFSTAEALVDERIMNGGDCFVLQRNLLTNRIAALEIQLEKYPDNIELKNRYAAAQGQLEILESGGPGNPCGW